MSSNTNRKGNPMKTALSAFIVLLMISCGQQSQAPGSAGGATGKGGSTARMAIVGNYLYALSGDNLITFAVEDPETPIPLNRLQIPRGVETMFPFGQKLYLGSNGGLYIYDLKSAELPELEGS